MAKFKPSILNVHLYCTDDLYFEDERKVRWLFDKEEPSSEQVAYCTLCFWVSICNREHSSEKLTFFFTEFFSKTRSAKHVCNFLWIDFISFCFSSMDWFHVIGMPKCKIDSTLRTEICNPIPGKNAFNADYNVFSKSIGHKFQIISGTFHVFVEYSFSDVVDDTDVHRSCMKVDTNVKLMLVLIESH